MSKTFTYYDSNFDKITTANKPGWWVAYKTESGDEGAVHIPAEIAGDGITNSEEEQRAIEKVMDWEWEGGVFCANARSFGFHEAD